MHFRMAGNASSRPCAVHKYHYPKPASTEEHHVQPKYLHGPDVPANLVVVCPTGHENIHRRISWLLAGRKGPEPISTRSEQALAQRGYDAWVAMGSPAPKLLEDL